MALSADTEKMKAHFIANKMRMEAALEGKPNHERHVENMIQYADAVAEAAVQQATAQIKQGKLMTNITITINDKKHTIEMNKPPPSVLVSMEPKSTRHYRKCVALILTIVLRQLFARLRSVNIRD